MLCAIISSSNKLSFVRAFLRCSNDLISASCCRLDDRKSDSFDSVFIFKNFSVFNLSSLRPTLSFAEIIKQLGFFVCSSNISFFVIRSDLLKILMVFFGSVSLFVFFHEIWALSDGSGGESYTVGRAESESEAEIAGKPKKK